MPVSNSMHVFEPLAEPVAVDRPAVIAKFSAAFADVSGLDCARTSRGNSLHEWQPILCQRLHAVVLILVNPSLSLVAWPLSPRPTHFMAPA